MAASITGIFTIIDRASGPMKKMEAQAIKTMAAIEASGKAHDKMAGSSNKAAQALDSHERAARNVTRTTQATTRALDEHNAAQRRVGAGANDVTTKLGRMGAALGGVGRLLMVMKFGAIGIGVGVLAQAIGTLAGGAVALVPALIAASGAIAAFPAVVGAAVQGLLTFKAAMFGVGDALKAGFAQQQNMAQSTIQMGDAHRQAAEAIRQAEHGIVMAQRSSRDAQEALSDARRQALRDLQDQKLAAWDAALGERGAALALRRAKDQLAQGAINPQTTGLDMDELRLAVQQARAGVAHSRLERQRAASDNARMQARGMDPNRNRTIRSAREGVADAAFQQTSATLQLADAQRTANRLVQQGSADNLKYQQALAQLPPVAQAFVKRLVSLRMTLKGLQASAAEGLIPGLNRALTSALPAVPMLQRVLGRTGRTLGNAIATETARLTTRGRLADIEGIGDQQARILGRMVHGVGNLAQALIDLMTAARPFTDWLTKTVEGFTKTIELQQAWGRQSGQTAAFLQKSRAALERFGRILSNIYGAFKGLMTAAAPLGERLWNGAERATAGWKRYLTSVDGSAKAKAWFDKLYDPLHELGQLAKDLAKAWARITVSPGFLQTVQSLRRVTPALESLLTNLAGLGPSAADALTALGNVLADLPFRPVDLLLRALTGVLNAIDHLLKITPGLGVALSGLLMAGAIGKSISLMSGLIGKWREYVAIAGGWTTPGKGKDGKGGGAGWLQTFLGGPMGGPGEHTPRAGTRAGRLGRAFRGAAGDAKAAGAGRLGRLGAGLGAMRLSAGRMFGTGAGAILRGGGRAAIGGLGRLGLGALRGAGKAFLPITAALGAFDFATAGGGIGNRAQAAVNGATFGLAGKLGWKSDAEKTAAKVKDLNQQLATMTAQGNTAGMKRLATEFRNLANTAPALDKAVQGGKQNLLDLADSIDRSTIDIRDSRISQAMLGQMNLVSSASGKGVGNILRYFGKLSPGARQRTGQAMVAMAAEMEKKGLLPKGAANRLRARILKELDGLQAGARRRTRQMITGIVRTLAQGVATISPVLGGLMAAISDPKNAKGIAKTIRAGTGVGVRENLRRMLVGTPLEGVFAPKTRHDQREADATIIHGHKQLANVFASSPFAKMAPSPQRDAAFQAWLKANNYRYVTERNTAARIKAVVARAAKEQRTAVTKEATGTQSDLDKINDTRLGGTRKTWQQLQASAVAHAQGARDEAGNAIQDLMKQALNGLVGMGYSRSEARDILKSSNDTTAARPSQRHGGPAGAARGARIGGVGLHDTVPVAPGWMAAPGELIVNRHTERRVNSKLAAFGTSLGTEVAGETRPHHAATGDRVQYGGVTPAIANLIRRLDGMGFHHGSTTGGTHAANSFHYRGAAVDYGDASNDMRALWRVVYPQRRNFAEMFGPSFLRPPTLMHYGTGFSDAGLQAQHNNHIHLALAAGAGGAVGRLGALAGGGLRLRRFHSRFGGAPGAMSQRQANRFRAALLGVAGGGSMSDLGGGVSGTNQHMARMMMLRMGWGAGEWPALQSLWMGESGFNEGARNASSGAYGIPQALPASKMGAAAQGTGQGAAKAQIGWGLNYIKGRYGSPANAYAQWSARSPHWYAMGGRTPEWGGWNAAGGRFNVNRPTLFGAGEGHGSETVTIRPSGGRGGGAGVTVHIGHIDYRHPGDLREAIREELEKVADDIEAMGGL